MPDEIPGSALNDGCPLPPHRPPTEAEVAEEAAMSLRCENMVKARAAVVAHLGGPWKKGKTPGARGAIPCPVCTTGTLGFSRSGSNGHVHAGCSTAGCVGWME